MSHLRVALLLRKCDVNSIAERIRAARLALGLTQADAASKFEIPIGSLRKYESGPSEPGSAALSGFTRAGINSNWLLTGEGAMLLSDAQQSPAPTDARTFPGVVEQTAAAQYPEFVFVPRYEVSASMGNGSVIHSELIVDYLAFREDWVRTVLCLNPKNLILINSLGDSMEPTLKTGDLLLIDRGSENVRHDDIYAFSANGDLRVKRIQFSVNGSIVIRSDNPRYDPEIIASGEADALRIIGRVVWFGRAM